MVTLRIRRSAGRRVGLGHLWISSNEIDDFDQTLPAEEDVRVEDGRGRLAGSGTINPGGLIAARLHARGALCATEETIIRDRLRVSRQNPQAWLGSRAAACRVAFGEADDLPGLVVDRYGDYLDAQMLTASMERRTPWILAALDGLQKARVVALRNDAPSREQEGLDLRVVLGSGHVPDEITFLLHDLSLRADLWDGQKTGLFSEQRENDRFLAPPAPDARVLDAFCYSGAWGLHASRWGPSEVVFLDASEEALALARINASANGATPASFVRADVLDFVCAEATASGFDLVILDPPAFAEFHRLVPQVLKGYLNLDKRGFAACSLVGTW